MDTEVSKAIFGLPGIAIDQPDVFETPDVPKNDNKSSHRTSNSDSTSVEVIKTNQADAYKRFEKSTLISNYVDFQGDSGHRGYQSWGEWQLPEGTKILREEETVLEKYHRLQAEVAELKQQLEPLRKPDQPIQSPLSGDLTVGKVIGNLDGLAGSLQSMKIDQWAENDFQSGTGTSTLSQLNKEVENLKNKPEKSADTKRSTQSSSQLGNCLTYELLCHPQLSRSADLNILNQLEQKLNRIENVIGIEKTSFLTNLSNERTIADSLSVLSRKLSQLDPSHLEQIDGRLTSLIQKLNQIQEGRTKLENVERDARLVSLLQILKDTESQRLALPVIASRLNSLFELEQQAAHFSGAISYLDSIQSSTNQSLKNSETDLKQLKETLASNLNQVTKTLEDFETRIAALQ